MQFSCADNGNGSKAGKFALIAGVHMAVGVLFVHSLATRHISLPRLQDQVLVMLQPDPPAPPPPPQPPTVTPDLAPPEVVIPKVDVEVAPPPDPAPVAAATAPDPQPTVPTPAAPAPAASAPAPQAPARASPERIRTAVLADANACALPAYPSRAARNGETGTTVLALLVGADGRVSAAHVQHGSGSNELDRAALRALSLCRFKPATSNGVPEPGWAQLAYVWTLD